MGRYLRLSNGASADLDAGNGDSMSGILISGGTGTFGRAFAFHALSGIDISRVVIFSRDEQKQEEMARELAHLPGADKLRYLLGDVRDINRLRLAMRGIEMVVHAAALKIVPKCEYDPIEAVHTNVTGTANVIQAAIECGVSRTLMLSTDKAVAPINLYGSTKLAAERLMISANHLSGSPGNPNAPRFSVVRYGNVAGSRGSVIPLFKRLFAEKRPLPITHPEMTRFWITRDQAVRFVIQCIKDMLGGEIFVPIMPSFRIGDLAEAIDPKSDVMWPIVGMRPGEKIHETLITSHDARYLSAYIDYFVINPNWLPPNPEPRDFFYSSDTNSNWLSVDDLRRLIA